MEHKFRIYHNISYHVWGTHTIQGLILASASIWVEPCLCTFIIMHWFWAFKVTRWGNNFHIYSIKCSWIETTISIFSNWWLWIKLWTLQYAVFIPLRKTYSENIGKLLYILKDIFDQYVYVSAEWLTIFHSSTLLPMMMVWDHHSLSSIIFFIHSISVNINMLSIQRHQ